VKQGICLLLFIVAATGYCYGQVLPIADVKEIDSSGSPIYMQTGEEVTVTGVVTVESGIFDGTKLDIYIQDETAGINVSLKSPGPFRVVRGDSIVVTGKISQGISSGAWGNTYLLVSNLEDITVVGKGTVPRPLVLTAEVMTSNSAPPLELYEGMLIRLEDVTIDPAEWPVDPGATKTVKAQDPTASFEITIDRDTDIGGTQPPPSPFIVIGVVVQDDFRFPYLSGYKLWPRARFEDFLKIGNGCGLAVLEPSVVENEMESWVL
jgi:hypothetical protein